MQVGVLLKNFVEAMLQLQLARVFFRIWIIVSRELLPEDAINLTVYTDLTSRLFIRAIDTVNRDWY